MLNPYALRTKDGYLLGVSPNPGEGSPCFNCVELWLKDRNVFAEKMDLADVHIRRELIDALVTENCAHVLYEVNRDGSHVRLDCQVFPHPQCLCARAKYIPAKKIGKNTNFAFSPLFQIKCARFSTTEGNLWLTSASGESQTGEGVSAFGVGKDRESSRFKAVDEWLKKAAEKDANPDAENFLTGQTMMSLAGKDGVFSAMGAGETKEKAILDALYQNTKTKVVRGYANSQKQPLLVVGANNWIRAQVPYFLLQQYDLHILFYPNSSPCWVVGIAAFSRLSVEEKPIFVFGADSAIHGALEKAIYQILTLCRPTEEMPVAPSTEKKNFKLVSKLNMWWTHWIYRCGKISLRDILHLEAYGANLGTWQEYFRDGQHSVSVASANSGLYPGAIRTLYKVSQVADDASMSRNVNGIGTWSSFESALN